MTAKGANTLATEVTEVDIIDQFNLGNYKNPAADLRPVLPLFHL